MSKAVLIDLDFGGARKVTGLPTPSATGDAAPKSYVDGLSVRGLSGFVSGKPAANEVVVGGIAPYALTLVQGNCVAKAVVAATASTTFLIKNNGTQIGTIIWSASGTTGAVTITTAGVTAGDNLTIHGPATPDATLADLSFLLRA